MRDLIGRLAGLPPTGTTLPRVISTFACRSIPFPIACRCHRVNDPIVMMTDSRKLLHHLRTWHMNLVPSMISTVEELQPEMAEGRSPILKFPVSPGCFHPTGAKRQEYVEIVREHVNALLADEKQYVERREQQLPPLDPTKWKQVQMNKELQFYKRIQGNQTLLQLASEEALSDVQQAVEKGYSSMICEGQVRGSLEDMMYGMTASSQEDLMTGFSYKDPPRDCVWLGSADGPTAHDPFHSADFIWAFPKKLPYHVDVCYLKASGIEMDQDGRPYGYLVLHSVDLPHCRPFEARKISRAKMYFTCIFREATKGYLNAIVRGIFDFGKSRGKIAKKLVTAATKSFMVGLLNGVKIGLAKKLTIMARRNRDTLENFKPSGCSICFKTKTKRLFGLDTHLSQCGVCKAIVCSDCMATTKQILFLGSETPCSRHSCCSTCMRDARVLCGIRPEEPEFQVIADYYLRRRSQSALPLGSPVRSFLSQTYSLDTLTRTRHPLAMKSNGRADLPTNSTANDSLDTDAFSLSRDFDEADFDLSDEESNSSIVAQADPSVNVMTDSEKNTLTVWKSHHQTDDNDFVPATSVQTRPELDVFHRTLLQLNMMAEKTYMQTQITAKRLRGADLD